MYIYTKHLLTALVQVTMMFHTLQETHQFDIMGILEPGIPNTWSNVTRVAFCRHIKQKILIFFPEICQEISRDRIDDQSFLLGLTVFLGV